jgi:hypothetical protein
VFQGHGDGIDQLRVDKVSLRSYGSGATFGNNMAGEKAQFGGGVVEGQAQSSNAGIMSTTTESAGGKVAFEAHFANWLKRNGADPGGQDYQHCPAHHATS